MFYILFLKINELNYNSFLYIKFKFISIKFNKFIYKVNKLTLEYKQKQVFNIKLHPQF